MKNNFSKRFLSIILSILMVVTAIPAFTVTSYAAEGDVSANLNRDPSLNKYIYAYFCGNQGCQLRFAVSDDGYNFEALNGGNVIATAETTDIITFNGKTGMGNQKGIRDPYIIKKTNAEGYYVVATDLDTSYSKNRKGSGNEYNNTNILVWDVPSLDKIDTVIPWSIDLSGWFPQYFGTDKTSGLNQTYDYYQGNGVNVSFCSWAPEVIWDNNKNMYMMYWSGALYNDLRIRYAYTNDFRTFYKADGTVLDGTTGEPDILYDPGYTSIDGDITYDKATNKYYMYYKDENAVRNGQAQSNTIRRVSSDNCSGPYTNEVVINSNGTGLEGPEVYQLNNGNYVLMGDNFANSTDGGRFFLYENDTIEGLLGGTSQFIGDKVSVNHLMPSHGAVSYITTEEYNTLIQKFGVEKYDSPALDNVNNVNDYLVARYFATENVTEDSTGHGYNLNTANNLTVESSDVDNKSNYAVFKGNGILTTDYQNGSYGMVDTTKMLNDYNFNATDGVTFSWSAKSSQTDVGYGAFYTQVQAGVTPGSVTYDGKNNTHYNTAHTFVYTGKPTFSAAGSGVGAAIYGSNNTIDDVTTFTNGWHDYTVTYTKGYMNLFIDGKLYNTYVTSSGAVREGCPLAVSSINDDWFKNIFTGNLYFGATVFNGADKMFDGAISDFRIYSKALNMDEVKRSTRLLNAEKIAEAMTDYETNMQNDTFIRTNYAETYKAYMDCKKAYDALTYGNISDGLLDDEINYDEIINNLSDKMQDSKRFVTPGTVNVYDANNNDNPIATQYASNLLYYDGKLALDSGNADSERGDVIASWKAERTGIMGVAHYTKLIMSDYVMLYDGESTLTAPVMFTYEYDIGTTKRERGIKAIVCTNPEFTTADWKAFEQKGLNKTIYPYMYQSTTEKNHTISGNASTMSGFSFNGTADYKCIGSSYITYNNTYAPPADGTIKKIDTTFAFYNHNSNNYTTFTASSGAALGTLTSSQDKENNTNAQEGKYGHNYGYIVNYVPVKEAQQRAMTYINSVKDYQVDNTKMLALLQAIDDSTAINLIGCFTNTSNVETSANQAQKMIIDAAQKIDDAIAALQVKTEDKYQSLRDIIPTAQSIAASENTKYTAESYAQFTKMFNDAQALMADVYGTNATHTSANNYNHNDAAGVIAEALENVLNDLMDVTELKTELKTKASIYNDSGVQVSTLSSWIANSDKIQKGHTDLVTLSKAPKYPVTDAVYTNLNGETVHYDRVDKSSTNDSQVTDAVNAVKEIQLEPVDVQDAYNNFDNVCAVVSAMDRAKYTEEALTAIDELYNQLTTVEVYSQPSADSAQLYQDINGVNITGRTLKNTTTDETDPCTISLLELVNGADVNKYKSYLSVQVDNGAESEYQLMETDKPYGDVFKFDVSEQAGSGSKVVWSATLYKKGDGEKAANGEAVDPIGSQKISNYTGSLMQRKADCDILVKAKIIKGTQSDSKTVYIRNGYGNVVSVMYVSKDTKVTSSGSTLTVGTETVTIPKFPFYTLTGWSISDNGTDVYATPQYSASDLKTITVNGGTATGLNGGKAAVANFVTLNADGAYGWAVKNGDKYQIVGYGSQYSFVVVNDEEYYPIFKNGYDYTVNSQTLTADLVDGFQNNTADNRTSNDTFLKLKLDNKAPFVYNQSVNGRTHYFRITANSDPAIIKAHGMKVTKPDGNSAHFASTAQNEGGQYSMSMKNDTVGYTFNGYVTYEFKYEFKGKSYSINTTEYCAEMN